LHLASEHFIAHRSPSITFYALICPKIVRQMNINTQPFGMSHLAFAHPRERKSSIYIQRNNFLLVFAAILWDAGGEGSPRNAVNGLLAFRLHTHSATGCICNMPREHRLENRNNNHGSSARKLHVYKTSVHIPLIERLEIETYIFLYGQAPPFLIYR
jgi:hypothetical protein